MADKAMHLPGVTRDGLKLSFAADDMPKAYSVFRALVMLSYPR
jgi:D-aminopeptidase